MLNRTSLTGEQQLFGRPRLFPTGNNIGISVIMMLVAMQVLLAWGGPGLANASATTDAALDRTWMRTDQPVAQQLTARTWIWGPQQNHNGMEMYKESPNGTRQVRYYDKSRMEINNPAADINSKWFVTNGLLVKELISGMIQVGDNSFIPLGASNEAVAGDPASVNPQAPTYLSFKPFASLNNDNRAANRVGQTVKERLYKAGAYDVDSGYNIYNVTYGYYEPILGHNVPNVFMQFFSRQGPVYENGKNTTGTVFDWIYAAGLPLTEPYWAKVKVGGVEKDVLVQAFERRVLTYTPANEDSWRVELGNVGSHYWGWRYTGDGKDKADPANNGGITPVPGGGNTGGGTGSPTPGNGGGGNGGGNGTPTPGNGGGGNGTPTPGNGGGGTVTPTPGGGGDGTPTPGGGGGGTVTPTPGDGTPTNGPILTGDISLSVGGPVDLNVGGTASVGVNVGSLNGLTGPVGLSIEGSIPGVSASLSASTVNLAPNGTAGVTLKLSANPGINPTSGGLTIKASAGGKTATAGVNVKLKVPGSFNLSGGAGVALKVGNVAHATVTLGATGGFSGQCSLSAKATGIGLSASVTPSVTLGVNGAASADVTINSSTLVGAGVVVVTATCNGITRTTSINVAVSVL